MAKLIGTNNIDIIQGSIFDDEIYGRSGDDSIYGNGGSDFIYGGTGNDKLYGNEGDDHIYGGSGSDDLLGGDGNDYLNGGASFNYLFGENGNDLLTGHGAFTGGMGRDVMIGNTEQDFFIYHSVLESEANKKHDVIKNFDVKDIINVSWIDANPLTSEINEAFVYIANSNPFSAIGQIKFDTLTHCVIANTDGNFNTSEFSVQLTGVENISNVNLVL